MIVNLENISGENHIQLHHAENTVHIWNFQFQGFIFSIWFYTVVLILILNIDFFFTYSTMTLPHYFIYHKTLKDRMSSMNHITAFNHSHIF